MWLAYNFLNYSCSKCKAFFLIFKKKESSFAWKRNQTWLWSGQNCKIEKICQVTKDKTFDHTRIST